MKTIKELRAAHAATTQGEWDFVIADNAEVPRSIVVDYNGEDIVSYASTELIDQNNAAFIALAHNEFPAMLDEIERLRDEVSILTEAARAVRDNWESGDLAGAVNWLSVLLED